MSYEGNRGDGLAIAQRFGARISSPPAGSGLWAPVSLAPRADGSKGLFPHLVLDRAKPGLIAVNSAGRRFVNEAVSYHDFVLAMFEANKTASSIPAWLICDAVFLEKYGLGVVYPGHRRPGKFVDNGYLERGATLDELAGRMSVDAATLRATVERHNEFAANGVDVDFGKGETDLNRFNGDPEHQPNPCIGPLNTPPFYALAVWPADIAVCSGLATDADARVLSAGGQPISGLYACGNDMASVMGGSYPGPGTTLGPGIVFAYRAARHAAGTL
jgi:succinate dehydrogenase/fumarate reductase flavoprotein subunit